MTYLKNLVGAKSLNTTQFPAGYLPELYPITSVNIYGKPWDGEESYPAAKKFTRFLDQQNST